MSYFNTKQALTDLLITSSITGIGAGDIAFENDIFDPKGKSAWLAAYFIPATTDITGKTSASSDEQRGIFQVSVFVKKDNNEYDNTQLAIIDDIISTFAYNTKIAYSGQNVDILSSTVNNGIENDSWFKRDVSINYLTFSER